jgi:hypothetical protein
MTALRDWVVEGSAAVQDIAYIEAFEDVRQDYVDKQQAIGHELRDPSFSPIGRVAIHSLFRKRLTLILFCWKIIDKHRDASKINSLKNAILADQTLSDFQREKITSEFRGFDKRYGDDERIKRVRKKIVAHTDLATLIENDIISLAVRDVLGFARAAIVLINTLLNYSNIEPLGTVENPIESDPSIVLNSHELASIDARHFWEHNFDAWVYLEPKG